MFRFRTKLFGDSLLYSSNNKNNYKTIISIIISIFCALFLSIIIAVATGYQPGTLISDLFTKAFLDYKTLLFNFTVMSLAALAFIFAFKVGLFNIATTSQMMTAGIVCIAIGNAMKDVNFPNGLSQIFMIVIAMVSASVIGILISLMKIFLKINEVVSSILINWILFFFYRYIIDTFLSAGDDLIQVQSVNMPEQYLLNIPGIGGWLPALIVLGIVTIIVWVTLKYTVFGKKLIAVGKSENVTKYVGYKTKTLLVSSMGISAAIAGILGYVLYTAGPSHFMSPSMNDVLPTEASNGVAVGLIAMSNPIAIIPVSFLLSIFQTSASYLETPSSFSNLIIGFIILGAAIFSIFFNCKPIIKLKSWLICSSYEKNYKKYINDLDKLISKYKSISYDINKQYKSKNIDYLEIKKIINMYRLEIYFKKEISKNELMDLVEINYYFTKKQIYAQYQKHNLVDKYNSFFWSNLELDKQINSLKHLYNLEQIRHLSIIDKKIDKIKSSKHINKNKITQLEHQKQKIQKEIQTLLQKEINKKIKKYNKQVINKDKINSEYFKALQKAQEIELANQNEKRLLIEWLDKSWKFALENKGK